jgi:hypothetical protein
MVEALGGGKWGRGRDVMQLMRLPCKINMMTSRGRSKGRIGWASTEPYEPDWMGYYLLLLVYRSDIEPLDLWASRLTTLIMGGHQAQLLEPES